MGCFRRGGLRFGQTAVETGAWGGLGSATRAGRRRGGAGSGRRRGLAGDAVGRARVGDAVGRARGGYGPLMRRGRRGWPGGRGARGGRVVVASPRRARLLCANQTVWCALSNFARNSHVNLSNIELASLELQRFWALLKVHAIELRAKFLGGVSVVTCGHRRAGLFGVRSAISHVIPM